jgi:hypothetical protein
MSKSSPIIRRMIRFYSLLIVRVTKFEIDINQQILERWKDFATHTRTVDQ